ncbi:hypothetical protein [Thermosipho melanesiensis]|uniref:Uncharacterized protein n=2 Tax=Thermosipho melanesiensis TaxID=46541 RepID=A6LNK7_THEM4|nr:hypothetical protein [Thermosipho melanesiensis]ABR31508.1 hypothetical protein Tmel_1665 [Thermosipho melanesiensis BI429]APT74934.1 hypothetical protein BW47_08815 [Thermosipho melanesiensis]
MDSLWKARKRIRERRPLIVEEYGKNGYIIIFLSAKNYTKKHILVDKYCIIEENEVCNFLNKDSFLFEYKGEFLFYIPKQILERYFHLCGLCKISIDEFLKR